MDKENIVEYIKWLISQLDEKYCSVVEKNEVKKMLLSIIGELYCGD